MLDNTEAAGTKVRKIRDMAQVGDTDAVFDSNIKHARSLRGPNIGTVNINGYIMQHVTPR